MKAVCTQSITALLLTLVLVGCDSGGLDDGVVEGIDLDPGRTLHYDWSLITSDTAGTIIASEARQYALHVEGRGRRVGSHTGLVQVMIQAEGNQERASYAWYDQTDDVLRERAYLNPQHTPLVQPKKGGWAWPVLWPKVLQTEGLRKGVVADSIQVREEARVVYKYPLEKGANWTSFSEPFVSTREVLGYEEVEVEAGTFWCAKISTRISWSPEMEFIDYVAEDGLILRTTRSARPRRDERGITIGEEVREERLELTAVGA